LDRKEADGRLVRHFARLGTPISAFAARIPDPERDKVIARVAIPTDSASKSPFANAAAPSLGVVLYLASPRLKVP